MSDIIETQNYQNFLESIKFEIKSAQQKAFHSVNTQMLILYYKIGQMLDIKQKEAGWGAKVIEKISLDILNELSDTKGFSSRNIRRMLAFYREYEKVTKIVPQAVAQINADENSDIFIGDETLIFQIPWGHNILLMEKIKEIKTRFWYMRRVIENGYSRDVLSQMIKSELHKREAKLTSNFQKTLPPMKSDLVQQAFKDPYVFDFLTLEEPFREKELELNLVKNMEKFLLELGSGFAFVGRQYKLEVDQNEFYIDLLFYHLKLRCYVVIELKKGKFKPEYSGQINFYCSVIDTVLANQNDSPTIGLILCQEKNEIVAEYSLKNMSQPIGISEYQLTEVLPKEFASALPSIEMIENELKKYREEIE